VPALLHELRDSLEPTRGRLTGQTLGELLDEPRPWSDPRVVRPVSDPVTGHRRLLWLTGSLAPRGALIKRVRRRPRAVRERTGRAVVFSSLEDLAARIDDPDLDVRARRLPGAARRRPGRLGHAGGRLPADPRQARRSRVSGTWCGCPDARMSGTAYGTIVLHVTPVGGRRWALALVRDGDLIALSVRRGRLDLLVDDAELARRQESPCRRCRTPARPGSSAATARLFQDQRAAGRPGLRLRLLPAVTDPVSGIGRYSDQYHSQGSEPVVHRAEHGEAPVDG